MFWVNHELSMNHPHHVLSTISGNSYRERTLNIYKLFSGRRMTVPKIQEFVYSSCFREIWRHLPTTSGVNWELQIEVNKLKGEEKVGHTIRRNGNLDCDSRQRLAALSAGSNMRATSEFEEKAWLGDVSSMRKPCNSPGTLSHQRTAQRVHKWAGDVVYSLTTLLQCVYVCIFYATVAFRSPSRTTHKW